MSRKPKPPKHFSAELTAWFSYYVDEFDMDPAEAVILEMMGDCLREYQGLRFELASAKTYTFVDRHGSPKLRPQLSAMNTCRISYARLRRELNLPIEEPDEVRLPRKGRVA
jgi:hypothetical protein